MHDLETATAARSYTGHVQNGVIVLDARADLSEGLPVRVEPLAPAVAAQARQARYRRAFQAIEAWGRDDPAYNERVAAALAAELPQVR